MGDVGLISIIILGVLVMVAWCWRILDWIWWRPKKLERVLKQQGFKITPYSLFFGDLKENKRMFMEARSKPMNLSHDIVPRVAPFDHQTIQTYGKMSGFWFGTTPRLLILDPNLISAIFSDKSGHIMKTKAIPQLKLLADGIFSHEGEKWAKHRRIMKPAFHIMRIKSIFPAISATCTEMISRWEKLVLPKGSYELDVWPEFQALIGEIVSQTVFGSSFEEGRRIFYLQAEQAGLAMQALQSQFIPGLRFLPTKRNKRMKEIAREVRALVIDIIDKKQKALKEGETNEDDLLSLLLESNSTDMAMGLSIEDIIQECKLFYFAGQDTTAVLLMWTMVVLSMHLDWQERARQEVLQVFGNQQPNFDGLNHLKIVTMILNEVLRLYPSAALLTRSTYKNIKLGEISLPSGVELILPIMIVQHDHELWGEDADEFKPERFSEGIAKATKNQVIFFPFGWGHRICIGQQLAMIEAKMALAMILQHFSFELSPSYAHAPFNNLTLHAQYDAQIILHKL